MKLDYIRPCKTREVSDDFDEHVKRKSNLPGVDYTCPVGEKVWATARGMIVAASNSDNGSFGKYVIIRHPDGRMSYYLHLSKVTASNGERVKAGHVIGLSGNTGKSTGPHLHFAIKNRLGRCVDPLPLIKRPVEKPKVIVEREDNGKAPAVKGIPG